MSNDLKILVGEAERIASPEDGTVDPGTLSFNFRAALRRSDPRTRDSYSSYMQALQRAKDQGLLSEGKDGKYRLGGQLEDEGE